MKLINLDECVINALNLFIKIQLPKLDLSIYKRPLVIGSGNAAITGRIIVEDPDALFADESNYKKKINKIDCCIIISASGGKHAPIIAREMNKSRKEVILITNNANSLAQGYATQTYIFPKETEPYTYNVSTYLGMILSKTKEDPKKILGFIKKLKIPKNLKKFDSYFILIPPEFENIKEMISIKFDELFGSKISCRLFTLEQAKHSKTIVPSDKELFIGLGVENKLFGKQRWNIKLPKGVGYAGIMSIGYYIIGQIQKQNKPYFKENISEYCKFASKVFGHKINPIVE